jgi:hypothetical protein
VNAQHTEATIAFLQVKEIAPLPTLALAVAPTTTALPRTKFAHESSSVEILNLETDGAGISKEDDVHEELQRLKVGVFFHPLYSRSSLHFIPYSQPRN